MEEVSKTEASDKAFQRRERVWEQQNYALNIELTWIKMCQMDVFTTSQIVESRIYPAENVPDGLFSDFVTSCFYQAEYIIFRYLNRISGIRTGNPDSP